MTYCLNRKNQLTGNRQLVSAALHDARFQQLDTACRIEETDLQILRLGQLYHLQADQEPMGHFLVQHQVPQVQAQAQAVQTSLQAQQYWSYWL